MQLATSLAPRGLIRSHLFRAMLFRKLQPCGRTFHRTTTPTHNPQTSMFVKAPARTGLLCDYTDPNTSYLIPSTPKSAPQSAGSTKAYDVCLYTL